MNKSILIQDYVTQNFDLYYDTKTQWPRVYGDDSNLTSCREKESVLQVENVVIIDNYDDYEQKLD